MRDFENVSPTCAENVLKRGYRPGKTRRFAGNPEAKVYKHVCPLYLKEGQEEEADEFEAVLEKTLGNLAIGLSYGWAWQALLPKREDFQAQADRLALLLHGVEDVGPNVYGNIYG